MLKYILNLIIILKREENRAFLLDCTNFKKSVYFMEKNSYILLSNMRELYGEKLGMIGCT